MHTLYNISLYLGNNIAFNRTCIKHSPNCTADNADLVKISLVTYSKNIP